MAPTGAGVWAPVVVSRGGSVADVTPTLLVVGAALGGFVCDVGAAVQEAHTVMPVPATTASSIALLGRLIVASFISAQHRW